MQQQIADEVAHYVVALNTLLPQRIQSLDNQRIVVENRNMVTANQVSLIVQFEQA